MKKQSSIDWLIIEMMQHQKTFYGTASIPIRLIEQAKQMHKDEIIVAFYEGIEQESNEHGVMYLDKTEAKEYYKEKFEEDARK